jgi:hypothetical protein
MSEQQTIDIDSFVKALEEMMDARDDMWQEERYHNHKQMWKIESERYSPARETVIGFLKVLIDKEKKAA